MPRASITTGRPWSPPASEQLRRWQAWPRRQGRFPPASDAGDGDPPAQGSRRRQTALQGCATTTEEDDEPRGTMASPSCFLDPGGRSRSRIRGNRLSGNGRIAGPVGGRPAGT